MDYLIKLQELKNQHFPKSDKLANGIGNGSTTAPPKFHDVEKLDQGLRAAQLLLSFVTFCIELAIASVDHSSQATFAIIVLLFSVLWSTAYGTITFEIKHSFFQSLGRKLREIRTGIAIHVLQTLFMLILAIISAASAKPSSCSNTTRNASYCRNKIVGTIFIWFLLFTWSYSFFLIIRQMIEIRTFPTSKPETAFDPEQVEVLNGRRDPFEEQERYHPYSEGDYDDPFEEASEHERRAFKEARLQELDPYDAVRKSFSLTPLSR